MEKQLYRSRTRKVIAGINGGLGDYLDIDPVILRIIFVLITIFHGVGIIIYIIMWIIIPEEQQKESFAEKEKVDSEEPDSNSHEELKIPEEKSKESETSSGGRIVFGVILIIIGLVFLSEKYLPFFDFEFVFAVGLIILGISLLFNFNKKSEKKS